jgi:hypothetical protein
VEESEVLADPSEADAAMVAANTQSPAGLVALLCASFPDGYESGGAGAPMATLMGTLRWSIWGLSLFLAASYALPSSTETEVAATVVARSGKRGRRQKGGGEGKRRRRRSWGWAMVRS